jgi:peptidyl-prolyl cis-trans isomerase D
MAIIGRIRKHYWLLVLIIGIALLLFVLSDFSRKSAKQTNNVGVIAGEKISISKFNQKVDENIANWKNNTGRDNPSQEEQFQIRQNTWQQMISDIMLQKQYDELGINVTDVELNDLIRGNNPHPYIVKSFTNPNTGAFDPKMVNEFLQNLDKVEPAMKERYLMLEKAIKQDRIASKYNALITKGFYFPTAIAKRAYDDYNNSVSVRLSAARYMVVPDNEVKVTDEDFQKYYNENNYKYFQDVPVRDIEYVLFDIKPSADDLAKIKSDIDKIYAEFPTVTDVAAYVNSNSDTRYDSTWKKRGSFSPKVDSLLFNTPAGTILAPVTDDNMYRIFKVLGKESRFDSLRASHILISYAGATRSSSSKTRESAEKTADSLLRVIKGNPAAFDALALAVNDDQTARTKGGDLNWFVPGQGMDPTFTEAVMNGSVGEVRKVETPFGFHLIKITGKKAPSIQIRVAHIDRRLEASERTQVTAYNAASAFAADNQDLEKFEKTVKEKGLNMRQQERLDQTAYQLPGISSARELVRWAFNKDTKKNTVSNVFDGEGVYVVATLKGSSEKGTLSLDAVKETIKPLVIRDKKAEKLMAEMGKLAKDPAAVALKYKNNVDTATITFGSGNIPNYGFEPEVVGKMFSMKQGQTAGPVKGSQGVFMFTVDKVNPAEKMKDYDLMKRQLSMYLQNRFSLINSIIEEKANIKDNRILFY